MDPHAPGAPTRHADRGHVDRAVVDDVLDATFLCHLGTVVDGRPQVLPTLFARVGDRLYLHGSTGARLARSADQAGDDGVPVCLEVTVVDGLVLARSAFAHSMNYRSVVVHGTARLVRDPGERQVSLDAVVDAVVAGRSQECRGPSGKELAATAVLVVDLAEEGTVAVAKVRTGGPSPAGDDAGLPYWAGVVPLRVATGEPAPAEDLADGVDVPGSVRRLAAAGAAPGW